MTHEMTEPDVATPEMTQPRAYMRIVGEHVGQIHMDCRLPEDYTEEQIRDHLRLELPGEHSPLLPQAVSRHEGVTTIAFFSSDIANSGKLPADCQAGWQAGQAAPLVSLGKVAILDADAAEDVGMARAELPAAPTDAYPKTVVVWVVAMLCIGILMAGGVLLTSG